MYVYVLIHVSGKGRFHVPIYLPYIFREVTVILPFEECDLTLQKFSHLLIDERTQVIIFIKPVLVSCWSLKSAHGRTIGDVTLPLQV